MIYPNVFSSLQPNHAEMQVFHALEKLGDGFDVLVKIHLRYIPIKIDCTLG